MVYNNYYAIFIYYNIIKIMAKRFNLILYFYEYSVNERLWQTSSINQDAPNLASYRSFNSLFDPLSHWQDQRIIKIQQSIYTYTLLLANVTVKP